MVANFQENNVIIVHYTGALLAFGCGLLYAWAQTIFSYMMNPKLAKPIVSHCRLFLCLMATFFFASMIIFGPILGVQPGSFTADDSGNLYKWTGHEHNYVEHVVGTCSEWLLAICFQLYILSFAIELRHAYCHAPKLRLIAYYCDGAPSESAISVQSGNVVTCCSGFTTKEKYIRPLKNFHDIPKIQPVNFNIELNDLEEGRGLKNDYKNDCDMPLGLDAADFVDPARQSAFDQSINRIKF